MTWAGSTGAAPCGVPFTAGSLTAAQYTQSFSYDLSGRMTSGPLGNYTYGDSAHLHSATQVGSGATAYTASYDAAGDLVCRAPTGSASCTGGANTGQQLTWDSEGRLVDCLLRRVCRVAGCIRIVCVGILPLGGDQRVHRFAHAAGANAAPLGEFFEQALSPFEGGAEVG